MIGIVKTGNAAAVSACLLHGLWSMSSDAPYFSLFISANAAGLTNSAWNKLFAMHQSGIDLRIVASTRQEACGTT